MEREDAYAALDSMRVVIDAELEVLIEEQSAIHGEVAIEAGKVLLAGGKRLRPILIQLAHQLAGGDDPEEITPLALAFELIHTATLVHDDINDEADTRRGQPTFHSAAGQAKGIIGGDWLFVQGFALGGIYDAEVVKVMADCCARIASAEFSQLDHVLDLSTSPEDYLTIVKGKTAGPFSAGCQGAAMVAGADQGLCHSMRDFGMELGIAFQLVDDLLDIKGDERMGKPRGADVYEGKMTLPLIHALTLLHGQERIRLAQIIKDFDDSLFDELITLLEKADSLRYTEILVDNHLERAAIHLAAFPECEARELLSMVLSMVKERNS